MQSGILTPVDMCRYIHVLYPFCSFFLSCASRHAVRRRIRGSGQAQRRIEIYEVGFIEGMFAGKILM
jgi:hypothetical protein